MSRKVAWVAAGVAGLLAAGGVTAASAASAAPPVAAPHWHIVKSVKTGASGDFTAVVATGKTTGWAFDGLGFSSPPTAWRQNGKSWTKFAAFPSKKNEEVFTAGASSPSDVWAFTDTFGAGSRVLHWNGAKWSVVKTFPDQIGGASVVARNDVWVFGFIRPRRGTPRSESGTTTGTPGRGSARACGRQRAVRVQCLGVRPDVRGPLERARVDRAPR